MEEQNRKIGFAVAAENDTKGTFEEIRSDARDLAEVVEQAGQRAARGINVIGDSAEGVAQRLTREEGRMSAAMLRATEQAQIAAKAGDSLSKAFEIKAELRGLDMSRLSPMVVQLREAEQALVEFKTQQSQQAGQNAFLDNLRSQAEALGKTRLELLELTAAQLGLKNEAAPYIAQLRDADSAMGKTGKSASELQLAMRGVPAVLGDIAVSIQGGVPAMTIFMQQGLQLRDMFGGFGAAARGVGSSILGMVNPFTAGATAMLALGVAYYQGSKEVDEYHKALVLSGNQAGTSVDQLNAMARSMASTVGTQGAAAAGLVEMAKSSKVGSDNLKEFTTSAVLWQSATGQAVSETAKQFAELSNDPLKASLALNEQMNYLTADVYNQIKALEQQGKTEEAAAVAQKAYSDAMNSRSAELVENLGYIEKASSFVTSSAKKMWDAVLGIGRTTASTDQFSEKIARLEAEIADRNRRAKEDGDPAWAIGTAKLQKQLQAVKDMASMARGPENFLATLQANDKVYVDATTEFEQFSSRFASEETRRLRDLTIARSEYNKVVKATKTAYADSPELAGKLEQLRLTHERNVAGINKSYERKSAGKVEVGGRSANQPGTKKEQEDTSNNITTAALDTASRAEVNYLATLERGADRNVMAVGWGSERRNIEAGRQQIEDRYLQQRQDSASRRAKEESAPNGTLSPDREKYYSDEQALIERFEARALYIYTDGVARRQAAEGDWLTGASRALEDYSYSAANVAQMSASAFTNAFKGMEDALVSFAMTGKADFKSLANSMIAEIVRMQARAAISGLFGGVSSGGGLLGSIVSGVSSLFGGSTANAKGGVYDSPSLSTYRNQVHATPQLFAFANGMGVFGEAGPEAIMPLTRAPDGNLGVRALAPLPTAGGMAAVQVEVFVDASSGTGQMQGPATSRSSDATSQQLGKMLGGMFKDLLTREMRPGGVLWAFKNGRA
ncbi:MAG: phage tail tape measure protein [Comamonas sp.]|jgi:lambda family phage tail tape measure protein|nr:phage tail tape measure protein [Comamonas sp.]